MISRNKMQEMAARKLRIALLKTPTEVFSLLF